MKITLVRHTAVDPKWRSVCYGNTNVPLADTFAEEAEQVRRQLNLSVHDAIFSSPLNRALSLAHYCLPPERWHLIETDDRLREMNFGEWEGTSWLSIMGERPDVAKFFVSFLYRQAPAGESLEDLARRVRSFLSDVQARGIEHPLVFCHGGVINSIRAMMGEISVQESFEQIPPYGSLNTFSWISDDRLRMID